MVTPTLLSSLLQAENAATAALSCGQESSGRLEGKGKWKACQGLVEELSSALYELAVIGNHRIEIMCLAPSGLACWALELLEEQACQVGALRLDIDSGRP